MTNTTPFTKFTLADVPSCLELMAHKIRHIREKEQFNPSEYCMVICQNEDGLVSYSFFGGEDKGCLQEGVYMVSVIQNHLCSLGVEEGAWDTPYQPKD